MDKLLLRYMIRLFCIVLAFMSVVVLVGIPWLAFIGSKCIENHW